MAGARGASTPSQPRPRSCPVWDTSRRKETTGWTRADERAWAGEDGRMTLNIAVIPGDGIGKEIVPEASRFSTASWPTEASTTPRHTSIWGLERWHATGDTLTDEDLEAIKRHDVILLGAVGDPSVPSGVLERGLLLKLRFALDHYVNLRPSKYYEGVPSPLANPGDIDFVVVREGTEGLYCGNGGAVRVGTPHEIATEVSVNTAYGVERVVRYAFEAATSRQEAPHPGPQAQRAGQRRPHVAPHRRRGRGGVPRRARRLLSHRRCHHLHGHRPRALRRDRHGQPCSVISSPTSRAVTGGIGLSAVG